MKKVNHAQAIQDVVIDLVAAHGNTNAVKATTAKLTETLLNFHDEAQAVGFIIDVLYQAILQGHADTVTSAEGKRNDKASNWKRDLGKAYNTAYKNKDTRLILKTSGKGINRTVTTGLNAIITKSDREKFEAKVTSLLEAVNTTTVEFNSISINLLGLYDAHVQAVEKQQAEMQEQADQARTNELARVTARVSAQLEAQDIKANKANIAAAMAMINQNEGKLAVAL